MSAGHFVRAQCARDRTTSMRSVWQSLRRSLMVTMVASLGVQLNCTREYRFVRDGADDTTEAGQTGDAGSETAGTTSTNSSESATTATTTSSDTSTGGETSAGSGSTTEDIDCMGPRTNCNGECVDLRKTTEHCGGCGWHCGDGVDCKQGQCERPCSLGCEARTQICDYGWCRCREGLEICGPFCIDPQADPKHCGGCGLVCNAGQVCSGGECVDLCAGSQEDCSGACVLLDSHPLNCGRCGRNCPTDENCSAGVCVASALALKARP